MLYLPFVFLPRYLAFYQSIVLSLQFGICNIYPPFCPVDLSPVVLAELVVRIRSTRMKVVMADAIFRNLCCRNGYTVVDEPLSLKKMVSARLFVVHDSVPHHLSTGNLIAVISLVFMKVFVVI